MRMNLLKTFSIKIAAAVAALSVVSASVASAQSGEYIVNSHVVSDEVVGAPALPGPVLSGSQYVGDLSSGSAVAVDGAYAGEVVDGGVVYEGGGFAAAAEGQRRRFGQPDLFYNFYTQGQANRVNAQMYLSPLPVPPNVGHTFYTYQPFMPHEMLYAHKDRYHNYYDNGRGMNRTRVTYTYPHVRRAASNFYWNVLRIPR